MRRRRSSRIESSSSSISFREGPARATCLACGRGADVVQGTSGRLYLRDDGTKDLLFVATGTGIAPMRSMILAQLQRQPDRPVTLFWGFVANGILLAG